MNDDQWLRYARNLGFPDAQYEEAVRLIGVPENANRFLDALIDVSARQNSLDQSSQKLSQTHNGDSLPPVSETYDTRSLASSSSCYSSITSVPSPPDSLKKIFIDGPNVARSHGKDAAFSWLGIRICVDWFLAREHRVKVFVPSERCHLADPSIIDYLTNHDALIKTPTGCNDDLFVIEAAMQSNAIIVSNDLFRDEARFNADAKGFIRSHRLPYIFVDDLFIPAKDPLGKTGPHLDDFLRSAYQPQESFHNKLTRTKSHQMKRNGPPMRHHLSLHRSLQASRSLPIQPPTNNNCFNPIPISNPNVIVNRSADHQFNDTSHTSSRLKQSLHKSVSVAYIQDRAADKADTAAAAAINTTGRHMIGGESRSKQALCRTKSHNI